VSAGGTASANLTLTSILGYGFAGKNQQLNDYNFPVSLSCDNLPPHSSCSFSYPNPDPNIPQPWIFHVPAPPLWQTTAWREWRR